MKKAVAFITAGLMAASCFGAEAFAESRKYDASATAVVAYGATVAKPTYTIKGTKGVRKIKLSTTTAGAQIYYTTDGTTPTKNSRKYTNGTLLKITKKVKIKAIAVSGSSTSAVMIKTFKVATKYGDVTGDGNINQNDYSRLKNYINQKTSYICKDNADCNDDGVVNQNDLTVLSMYLNDSISSLPYRGNAAVEVEDEEADEEDIRNVSSSLPRPGITVYRSMGGKRVEFTSTVSGVSFYYTLNGADPTTRSNLYKEKFLIDTAGTYTVKVIAYKNGEESAVQQTTVTVGQTSPVTCPVSTSTNYADSVQVSLNCATADASIYYTTDGTDPRTSSTARKYTRVFDAYPEANAKNVTIKAYARSKANADSTVSQFTFNVTANFTISGNVWDDTSFSANMDGIKSNGESGISGIKVYALNVNNNTKAKETVTDYAGNYTLTGLMPTNTYRIIFEFNYQKYRPYTLTKNGGNQALLSAAIPQLVIKNGGAYNATGTLIAPNINTYANATSYSGFIGQAASYTTYTSSATNVNLALSSKVYGSLSLSIDTVGAYTTATSKVPSIMNDEKLTYKITITNTSASESLQDVAIGLYFTDALSNINMVKGNNNVYVTSNFDGTRNGYRCYTITNLLNSSALAAGQSISFTVSGNVNAQVGQKLSCYAEVTAYRFASSVYDYYSVPGNLGGPNSPKEKDEAASTAITVISSAENTTNATISLVDDQLFSRSGKYLNDLYQGETVTVQIYFEGITGQSDFALESYDGTCVRHSTTFKKLGSGYLLELTVIANTSAIPGTAYYNIYIKKDPTIKLRLSFSVLSIYKDGGATGSW